MEARRPIRYCKRWKACPMCLAGVMFPWPHLVELNRRYHELKSCGVDEMAIAKPNQNGSPNGVPGPAAGGDWGVLFPTLVEYLTSDRYEDGSARLTSTLLVFAESGTWKACFADRDNDRNTFVSAGTPEGCLGVLEERLKSDTVEWKPRGGAKSVRRK